MSAELLGGLLIGGQSQRMGRPKQLIERAGQSFAEHGWDALAKVCPNRFILGTGALPRRLKGAPQLPDRPGLKGPLAGMCAAFDAHPNSAWLIVACDMPLLDEQSLRWLVALRGPDNVAVQSRLPDGTVQPLFAIYEPRARVKLEALAHQGRGPSALQSNPDVKVVTIPERLSRRLININTPGELEELTAADLGAAS